MRVMGLTRPYMVAQRPFSKCYTNVGIFIYLIVYFQMAVCMARS